jgi:LAO/AO transport system kinase
MTDISPEALASLKRGLTAGNRSALGQAITLIESTRSDHRNAAAKMLAELMPSTGKSMRLAISGIPGSGKSTLIERLGQDLTALQHRVAVLAVDPSSVRSGGSILGDKTRMTLLASNPNAFIRPSPTAGTLGGVARRTREAILLCEAAGYDVIIIETVGVGQSEITATHLCDYFVLVGIAGAGDELQGIKRGILEIANLVVINKADGDNRILAERAAVALRSSLHILGQQNPIGEKEDPAVLAVSSLTGEGFTTLTDRILSDHKQALKSGRFKAHRNEQLKVWLDQEIDLQAIELVRSNPKFQNAAKEALQAAKNGLTAPSVAAQNIINECIGT